MISPAAVLLLLLSVGSPAALAQGQRPTATEWNSARALELVNRAQQRRSAANADTGLVDYEADARARVYFYLDREDTGERNLVKTDQLALEVAWRSPDLTKQRIVGWRDRKALPTNIRYHIDHLAVVMENFGDEIRIGDGDEVRDVPHPASPDAEGVYEYRLVDSLTLSLPGAAEPVRVYELQVRPRDSSRPAIIGSIFVERRAGDLVRMDFTFTGAAYRDRYLDYINISLDNGLWKGRFWLPNRQRVEIRRRIPQLDVPAGSVIRGVMEVDNYRFNQGLPLQRFAGAPVTAAPAAERESFPFEEPLEAELREEGIGPAIELREIRKEAARLVASRALQGAAGLRLRLPSASEVLRYNRAEGVAVALGASATPVPHVEAGVRAGWAFGAEHPLLSAALSGDAGASTARLTGFINEPRDVGARRGASGVINTLSALFAAEDYLDPFYASGGELSLHHRLDASWLLAADFRAEAQRPAERTTRFAVFADSDHFRPVQPVERGTMLAATIAAERQGAAGRGNLWSGRAAATLATLQTEDARRGNISYILPHFELRNVRQLGDAGRQIEAGAAAGAAVWGELPPQSLLLIGGRGTLPGYPFRAFGGDRYALVDATLSMPLIDPWVTGRLSAATGWAGAGDASSASLSRWPASPAGEVKAAVGIGAGLFYDILHVDLWRGISGGGRWELVIEANRAFWDFL